VSSPLVLARLWRRGKEGKRGNADRWFDLNCKIFDLRSLAAAVVLTRTVGQRRLGLCDNRATISLAGPIACITSSFDASATRTASIWLSAGASFVRFSTQGIALYR
jgi:hypothetical protein